ncbi:alpha-2,8-sialyltransferase 8E isoform X3 [Callithrix jacchus]|uniref:alpha-2,8-sialyltransferase 8E isoform X3 n=1 Tax=Callithrix jacchus TaxID=9483 RepID=UPI0023DD1467|nr:alpha-2,8-sialyltransferase 8E isoform X3 [Callithrix jacchus]
MRYADPSANRDLLGNRTLLFIFICAFALVTLLQQILYGRNYIKRGLPFGWQSGDQLTNWTGLFNVTDDPAVQSGSDSSSRYFEFYEGPFEYNSTRCLELRHEILEVKVLSMVKQSELFDRWKSLQMCKWAMNISEANQFKSTLSRCCNAPAFLFTTQKNTPLGTKLKYEVDTSGIYHINQEIFRMFPKDMPYYRSQFKKCAVVGNGGILKNSRCGREINSADFVFSPIPLGKPLNCQVLFPHLHNGRCVESKGHHRFEGTEDSGACSHVRRSFGRCLLGCFPSRSTGWNQGNLVADTNIGFTLTPTKPETGPCTFFLYFFSHLLISLWIFIYFFSLGEEGGLKIRA